MVCLEDARIVMLIWLRRGRGCYWERINKTQTHNVEKSITIGEQQLKYLITLIVVLSLSLIAAACTGSGNEPPAVAIDTPAATLAPATAKSTELAPTATAAMVAIPGDISVDALGNATSGGILNEVVTPVDGRYAGEPFVAGGASRPTATLLPETVTKGALDGAGRAAGAAGRGSEPGGSGT